jgi:hypothetical protein
MSFLLDDSYTGEVMHTRCFKSSLTAFAVNESAALVIVCGDEELKSLEISDLKVCSEQVSLE